jgi:hypothetical protein
MGFIGSTCTVLPLWAEEESVVNAAAVGRSDAAA